MEGAVCVLFRLVDRRFAGGWVSVAVLVVLCAVASPASASTAQLIDVVIPAECKYVPPGGTCVDGSATALVYQAGPDEANRVSLTGTPQEARISDPTAVIEPGSGCSSIDSHSVRCPAPGELGVSRAFVATGSGPDTVRTTFPWWVIVDGGPGNDVLVGGPFNEWLYAGRGDDVLRGGDGGDRLYDASVREPLRGGDLDPFTFDEEPVVALTNPGRGRDSFDGGKGSDTISYEGRSAGVRVDLANTAPIGGTRGERDSVGAVETALGGRGDDRLAGNRRSNWLTGGDGDDRIAGRRGNDTLEGGNGRDVMLGGPGTEQLTFGRADQAPDRASCGAGMDRLFEMAPSDFLNDDCERLFFDTFGDRLIGDAGEVRSLLPLRAGLPPNVLSARLTCLPFDVHAPCQLRMEVRVHGPAARRGTAPPRGTLLGSSSHTFALGEQKIVSLRLSRAGVELVRRHRALRVRVITTGGPPFGPSGYLTVLRTP
jgi:RTX calcium-binding nonapeptide repeat (4 copies)